MGYLPGYQHDNLTDCFSALDEKIRAWLELMLPTNCVTLNLRATAPWLWSSPIQPEHTAAKSR